MIHTKMVIPVLVLCAFCALVPFASADVFHPELVDFNRTITFADLGLTGQQDVQIWQGNILVETANTTSGRVYAPVGDYMVVVKPTLVNRWLNNPGLLLKDAVDYILAFALPIFIILALGAILIGLSRAGRRH